MNQHFSLSNLSSNWLFESTRCTKTAARIIGCQPWRVQVDTLPMYRSNVKFSHSLWKQATGNLPPVNYDPMLHSARSKYSFWQEHVLMANCTNHWREISVNVVAMVALVADADVCLSSVDACACRRRRRCLLPERTSASHRRGNPVVFCSRSC